MDSWTERLTNFSSVVVLADVDVEASSPASISVPSAFMTVTRSGAMPGTAAATDSHLVRSSCRAGCDTKRCQTTAQTPSVWGVTRSGTSGGMMTAASANLPVSPPSRPTTP